MHLNLAPDLSINLVDLPGCYSLHGRSPEEWIAAREILGAGTKDGPAELAVVVLDATALERGLFLLLQILELNLPVVCAVNMLDEAERAGMKVDLEALSSWLGIPCIGIVAVKRKGLSELRAAIAAQARSMQGGRWSFTLRHELEAALRLTQDRVSPEIRKATILWLLLADKSQWPVLLSPQLAESFAKVAEQLPTIDWSTELSIARYQFIDRHVGKFVSGPEGGGRRLTDRIDRALTHPLFGTIIFLGLMTLIFDALFSWSAPMMDFISGGFGFLSEKLSAILPDSWVSDLLTKGIIAGVGTMLSFLPQIMMLLFFMAVLEASGYLARAAFLIDRLMRGIGLNGKAFVPMISGYACAVPAILSLRTMENRRDRLLTMSVIPLMSCSARLPVYTLILATMFPVASRYFGIAISTWLLLGLYVASAVLAMFASGMLSRTVFRGQAQTLLLELPPYRLPDWRNLSHSVWLRSQDFLKTAGTIIVVLSAVMWLLLNFPRSEPSVSHGDALRASYAGQVGTLIEPAIEPLGFDWKIGIGLIGSFAAREVFVATMGVIHDAGDDPTGELDENQASTLAGKLREQRRADGSLIYTPRTGFSLLFFFMLACQCTSTLAVVRRETGTWRWPAFMFVYMTALAYAVALAIYQVGGLLGLA